MSIDAKSDRETFDAELNRLLVGWKPDMVGTLMFVVDAGKVLLIHKKRGHGAGKINAPGGKIEPGETAVECALRETLEEVGIKAIAPRLMGTFKFVDQVSSQWLGYAFVATAYEGQPVETAEARPQWFEFERIPFALMWDDDQFWLPEILAGRAVTGEFLFDDGALLTHRLRAAR
jgi:8-oxo-dGTP diphosphatase